MPNRGRQIAELRRSNASGIHDHQLSRSQLRRHAIEEGEDFMDDELLEDRLAEEYEPEGPSDEELALIEDEDFFDDEDDLFDEDEYELHS
jgi:hypothetical protein